jgi:hypothetical protein
MAQESEELIDDRLIFFPGVRLSLDLLSGEPGAKKISRTRMGKRFTRCCLEGFSENPPSLVVLQPVMKRPLPKMSNLERGFLVSLARASLILLAASSGGEAADPEF